MKVKLPSGVILEHKDPSVVEGWLQAGGVEVVTKPVQPTKEKATAKKEKAQDK